mmetsp:Transcript_21498/g.31213  ORF Transcript_21498/g.31213 Transcript_21498/m.31213 type:complete len:180 (+) Transcript_21498:141-680(+)|eukprot:CAMPEP_0185032582 /NCGR_PEP_ID=MMETSP1103-20130426/20766_1 /TAXON_ID=36769 /ORGANISM="Paraphysomonas bandaiensis, Strain Caron Lab Isolate" /LENGTH=179 /DNA_ID=CAMNT_0027568535 /DNA_START=92 /DNA_END=631 /DNA_ORIENTATION=+
MNDICKHKGGLVGSRFDGHGNYDSAHGGKYIGNFLEGLFHGEGTLYVKGGYFKGEWEYGKMVEGKFYFSDGLEYEAGDEWTYCTEEDPRFQAEIEKGVEVGGELLYTTANPDPPRLPPGCYDIRTGYYDPKENSIMSYTTNDPLRPVDDAERDWIIANCRVSTEASPEEQAEQDEAAAS